MADGHDKPASCVFEMMSCQTIKLIPHNSLRIPLRSPNLLKSHLTFDLRPPDPGGPSQPVGYDRIQPENEERMPPKKRKKWLHRELEALRELNGNVSPGSSQGSDHNNHLVRLSQSSGSSSTSGVSLGTPPSKLTMGSGLGISYNNMYGHNRPPLENGHQEGLKRHQHQEDNILNKAHHHHPSSMPPPSLAPLSSTSSPPSPTPTPLSPHANDAGSIASSSPSPINSGNDIDDPPIGYSP